jgi:hypothetical protein
METQSTEIKDLAAALAKAQAEIKPALKDADNPFFKSKYADLASVQAACMPHLTKNGLSVVQAIQLIGDNTVLVTTLMHSSGQWLKSVSPVKPTKNDPQGLGSALTYMRRYSLAALVGVAQEDDDGNAATAQKEKQAFVMNKIDRTEQETMYEQCLAKLNGATDLKALEAAWKPYANSVKNMDADLATDLVQKKDELKTSYTNGAH